MKTRKPTNKVTLASQLKNVAKGVKGLTTMADSLEITRYVPTIYPSVNRAIVLGGAPLGCIWTVHGEYGGGKSTFCAGLVNSFIQQNHIAAYIDSEHAVSKLWFQQLGTDVNSLLFYRPDTLEDAVDTIDSLIEKFDEGRADGSIPDDKGMIIVVDSINKLTPANEFARLKKEGAEALDKGLARFRGLLLQSWLDHMTPIIGKRDIALVCIAQERELKAKNKWDPTFKVKGCQGLLFDSFVQIRVMKGSKIWIDLNKKKKILTGTGHNIIVFKNKVGFPYETGNIFTSNGKGYVPIGFNHPKTLIEEDAFRSKLYPENKIITQCGGWYYYKDNKWHGEKNLIIELYNNTNLYREIREKLNDGIKNYFNKD